MTAKHNVVKFVCQIKGANRTIFFKGGEAVGFIRCVFSQSDSKLDKRIHKYLDRYQGSKTYGWDGIELSYEHWLAFKDHLYQYTEGAGYGSKKTETSVQYTYVEFSPMYLLWEEQHEESLQSS